MSILKTIGHLSVDEFMRRHWQRAPLLARNALPDFVSPVSREDVFEMAGDDALTSRLATCRKGRWTLQHGPFDDLPSPRRSGWTVLVNGVDRHLDAAHELLARFRFLPDARLDDLMVSYASDGGGVGPHVDSYDVFLLQASGRRRWRIAPPGDATLIDGAPLKLLAQFEPTQEWVLEPGDLLYLPPGWGHDGTAVGECITLSVGFRAPSRHEFLSAFLAAQADSMRGPDSRFSDRGRPISRHPGELPDDLSAQLHDWALDWRPRRADIERFIGCWLTEPAPEVWFESDHHPGTVKRFALNAQRDGVQLDRRTRMAWRAGRVYINGEVVDVNASERNWLRRLADSRRLDAAQCRTAWASETLSARLCEWRVQGWLHEI